MGAKSAVPIGWYVRVTTNVLVRDEPVIILYLVGYPEAAEAEDAVRQFRATLGEKYQVVASAVVGRGPQPDPKEVRELKGAVFSYAASTAVSDEGRSEYFINQSVY
jgi:hypothetical protein